MNPRIEIPSNEIAALCNRWQVLELALFGSVLRDDFGPESDVDVLVSFDPQARHTLLDVVQMQEELSATLGRKADLVERAAVEQSPNYIRRQAILQSAETIYAV
jgi:predicted nucleotidyltransferase